MGFWDSLKAGFLGAAGVDYYSKKSSESLARMESGEPSLADLQREIAEQRARFEYMTSPEGQEEMRREAAAAEAKARLRAVSLWITIEPQHRLRPDRRAVEGDGGRQAGADLDYKALDREVELLYGAALAGGSHVKFAKMFFDPESEPNAEAEFHAYDAWLAELRQNYPGTVADIFAVYDDRNLCGYEFHAVRRSLGMAPADENYYSTLD